MFHVAHTQGYMHYTSVFFTEVTLLNVHHAQMSTFEFNWSLHCFFLLENTGCGMSVFHTQNQAENTDYG